MKEEEVNTTGERLKDEEGENFVEMKKPNAGKEAYKVAIGLSGKVYDETENVSLQDSFAKFRNQKLKERKLLKAYKQNKTGEGRSDEFKQELRTKFIDRAKAYFGVPYHKKYQEPDAPEAPLYLDCCGLVRQVMRDLADDFGFPIARWNQSYQFDILPAAIPFEELKPGDLIFYEGEYLHSRSKPQKHNMVHVEIFIGGETGEETIGARFFRGKVQAWPSYKFTNTSWTTTKYHFKSIDAWLEGKHESYCCEHAWHSETLSLMAAAGKRSIFNDEDAEDEDAGGMEEETPENSRPGSRNEGDDKDKSTSTSEESDANFSTTTTTCMPCESPRDVLIQQQAKEIEYLRQELAETKAKAATTTEGEGNGNLGPSDPEQSSTPSRSGIGSWFKTQTQSTPTLSRKISRSLETLPLTPKISSDSPSRSNNTTPVRGPRVRVTKSMELKKAVPTTYYVAKANGWKLWKEALDNRGWQQLPFDYKFTTSFGLKYVEGRGGIDYKAHNSGQLVCHIPNNNVITTKMELFITLRDFYCRPPPSTTGPQSPALKRQIAAERKPTPWVPETFLLNHPMDCQAVIDLQQANDDSENPQDLMWIYKPSSSNRGRGLRVISGMESLKEIVMVEDTPGGPPRNRQGIIQHYLTDPLLIDGYKFDIRCYMLIARTSPNYIVFYHPGYCRMTLKKFEKSLESLEDSAIHLTNAAVQKQTEGYKDMKEFQVQTPQAVADAIEAGGNIEGAKYMRETLDHDIKCCMVDVIKAAVPKFQRKHGYFDLLGFDFMVTNDNKLVLLEVNTNPALSLDNSTLASLLPPIIDGTVDLVLRTQGPERNDVANGSIEQALDDAILSSLPNGFCPIYNEKTKFKYSKAP